MKAILSIGFGRLHLMQAAQSISGCGIALKVLCGWVPRNCDSKMIRFFSAVVGRDIASGLRKRMVAGQTFEIKGTFIYEAVYTLVRICLKRLDLSSDKIISLLWAGYGFWSRCEIKGAEVFHVRSGAGNGGAIKKAKKIGMKVLVDHSALHPEQSEVNLKDDCKRWDMQVPIAPHSGVWRNVLKDCAEADVLMVNANHIRDSFVARGYDPEKIRVVYLGVRDDFRDVTIRRLESGKKNDVPRILYTGNFSLLKGAEYLLESLRILEGRGVKAHCDIVGAINAPKAMLDKYNGLTVTFHGPIPQDDLKRFLSESDVYLFPSLADGCAQSGMEALTAGLPVVATYQSGLPITDGDTGCVVPMKNAMAIAEKVEWLIAHPEERERLGRNAAKMMREKYTWEKYAENVKSIYDEMLKG